MLMESLISLSKVGYVTRNLSHSSKNGMEVPGYLEIPNRLNWL